MNKNYFSPHHRLIEISDDFFNYKNGSDLFIGYLLSHMTYSLKDDLLYITYENYVQEIPAIKKLMGYKTRRSVEDQLTYWRSRSDGYLVRETLLINGRLLDVLTIRQPETGTQWIKMEKNMISDLINCSVPNILRVYVWLCSRQQSFDQRFNFRKKDIAKKLGYQTEKRMNDEVSKKIQTCLETLEEMGIISYSQNLRVIEGKTCRIYTLNFIRTKAFPRKEENSSEKEKTKKDPDLLYREYIAKITGEKLEFIEE